MQNLKNLHPLTHAALEELQHAFQECRHAQAEGLILSALVKIKQVHDVLADLKETGSDFDAEELCCAV